MASAEEAATTDNHTAAMMDPLYMEERESPVHSPFYASSTSFGSTETPLPEPFYAPHLEIQREHQQHQHHTGHTSASSSSSLPSSSSPKLGVVSLSVLVFYSVSGGPVGIEPAVRAAGNLYSIIGFCLLPVLWSGPEALLTAELGSAFPDAAGGVAWVQTAFGKRAGWMCGVCTWMGGATDNAIYPVLFIDYLLAAMGWKDDLGAFVRWFWLATCSSVLAYINWWGLPTVGKMSLVICIVAMSPFIILTLGSLTSLQPQRWLELPPPSEEGNQNGYNDDVDNDEFGRSLSLRVFQSAMWTSLSRVRWAPFLNNLFWNGNSFDSCANFAADVDNPGRVFPRALGWSVILITLAYVVPLMVTLGATPDDTTPSDWIDGYLAKAAGDIMGPWMGGWTVFAAGISNIALFEAELSSDAYQLMGMADHGYLPRIFSIRSRHGTPTYGILLGTLVIILMTLSDLEGLIEMLNFNYSLALLMEYAAFVKLRISRPELPRPYRIPLSTPGCLLLFATPVCLTILIMCLASWFTLIFSLVFNVSALLLYQIKKGGHNKTYENVSSSDESDDA